MNLTSNYRIERVAPDGTAASTFTLAAGTTTVNSAAVDLLDFASVVFSAHIGAITGSGQVIFTVEGSANGSTGWTALTGATTTVIGSANSNKIALIGVARPASPYRYVRLVSARTVANVVLDAVTAFAGDGRLSAPTHPTATVAASVYVA
jgi:uncharacterized protein with beta-barrel porin domain